MSNQQPIRRKNPLIAAALSFFLSGAGQLYNENYGKAIILFSTVVASILTIIYTGISMSGEIMHDAAMPNPVSIVKIVAAGLILFGIWLYGIIDAVISAQRFEGANSTAPTAVGDSKPKEGVIALGVLLMLFGFICLLIQFGLKFEFLIKYGFPLALILLGIYLMAKANGLIKGGK